MWHGSVKNEIATGNPDKKQIALEKQRKLLHEKSEEEYLHACISASRKLLDEPEFEGILFDPELMQKRVMEVLDHIETENEDTPINEPERLLEPEGGSYPSHGYICR